MCGILAVFGCIDNSQAKRSRIIELSRRLRHRGPDWSGLHTHDDCYLAHQRLAIVDPTSGDQPLYNEDKTIIVAVNGEIYNHMELREKLKSHQFRTGSDCEVIAHLYEEYGENFIDMLDGMFSFVLLDTRDKSYIAARDAIGITPLYMGWGLDGSVWFSSEMKALSDDCERFVSFLPGHIYSSKNGGLRRWYNPPWFSETIPSTPYDHLVLRKAFEKDEMLVSKAFVICWKDPTNKICGLWGTTGCYTRTLEQNIEMVGDYRPIECWQEELQWACRWAKKKTGKGAIISCVFAMVVSIIWREMNNMRFKNGQFQSERLCREIAIYIHIIGRHLRKWKNTLDTLNHMP
ncbi:asparagine synthetase [glutamine-hydrolyzing] 2-like [Lycium ferocissimum]|uniref:asparagine synthetase [glutamine-hydrolyzing] 2-like n=1 Tax=Lycium ferocissimum TaxID=112874 RepID=UPI002815729D|nr:asparagine synthetase [glutamine-hydrolyzing] 2-like [Lycium ferocissimum]